MLSECTPGGTWRQGGTDPLLTSALDRGCQPHTPATFPQGKESQVHTGEWVGPTAGLDKLKRQISCSCRERYHSSSEIQPAA
jgi:hypothetical protein